MAENCQTLAARRSLSEPMRGLELQHKKQIVEGDDPASVDQDIAEADLASEAEFFLYHGIESQPLTSFLHEFAALSAATVALYPEAQNTCCRILSSIAFCPYKKVSYFHECYPY